MTASRGVASDGAPSTEQVSTRTLFGAAVLIWGTTWFAIKFQLDAVAPEFGVALRFLVASLLVLGWCAWRGLALRLGARSHAWLALQGACGFSLSYVLIYHAERLIVSGLVAVGYAAAPLINMLFARVFFSTPIAFRVAAGGALGLAGIVLVFWPNVESHVTGHATDPAVVLGAAFTMTAVVLSCLANMITLRLHRAGVAGWPPIGVAMAYSAVGSFAITVALGRPLSIEWSAPFLLSLAYLAWVGSVLAFGAYFTLLARIGAARASYIGVMTPLVALLVSTLFERFDWKAATFLGVGLAVAGNLLALRQPRVARP
jgi:drug/metabolite transporter (DMT)-like permease